jgi:hypothetical protein
MGGTVLCVLAGQSSVTEPSGIQETTMVSVVLFDDIRTPPLVQ